MGFFDILNYIYLYGCVRVHLYHMALVEVSGQLAGVVLSVLISLRGVLGTELKCSGVGGSKGFYWLSHLADPKEKI